MIFVFGSNLAGSHAGGAAREALINFEAQRGIGVGLTGRSYAIPTMDANLNPLELSQIKKRVDDFLQYARDNAHKEFFVTAIGCGIAGFKPEQIAPMFANAPENCTLHRRLVNVMQPEQSSADAVECAKLMYDCVCKYGCSADLANSFDPDKAAAIIQQYGNARVEGMKRPYNIMSASISDAERDFVISGKKEEIDELSARVAELTQRNAELESKLTAVLDTVKHYENVVYKPNKDRRWAITCLRQKIEEIFATLASQGGNGER